MKRARKEQQTRVENLSQILQGVLRVPLIVEVLTAVSVLFRINCGRQISAEYFRVPEKCTLSLLHYKLLALLKLWSADKPKA